MSDNETGASTDGSGNTANALIINTVNRPGIQRTRTRLNVCLLSYNQVQIPLTEPCLQRNFSLIKRFSNCSSFPHPLPLEKSMLPPNSFTHASYTHQRYNCSCNERAEVANRDGNHISNPATLAAPIQPNHHLLGTYMHECKTAEQTMPQTDTSAPSAQLCFLLSLIWWSSLQLVLSRPKGGSTGISLPSVVSYAKLQTKVTQLRARDYKKKKKISPLHVYQQQKENRGSFQKAITHDIPKMHNGIHFPWRG